MYIYSERKKFILFYVVYHVYVEKNFCAVYILGFLIFFVLFGIDKHEILLACFCRASWLGFNFLRVDYFDINA